MNALRMSDMEQRKTATKPAKGIKKKPQEEYNAALYLRLSRDEGENESVSIGYQREMLENYAREHGYNVYGEYVEILISSLIQCPTGKPVGHSM